MERIWRSKFVVDTEDRASLSSLRVSGGKTGGPPGCFFHTFVVVDGVRVQRLFRVAVFLFGVWCTVDHAFRFPQDHVLLRTGSSITLVCFKMLHTATKAWHDVSSDVWRKL